jgi:hypothetical protein
MADTQAFENLQRYGLCFGEEDEFIDKLDNGDYLKRADVLALASRPAEVDDSRPALIDGQLIFDPAQSNNEPCLWCAAKPEGGCWVHNRPSHTTNKEK